MIAALNTQYQDRRMKTMNIKTNVKAGGVKYNHNQTVVRGLKVKTNVKAGGSHLNHSQTVVRGLKLKTNVKEGRKTMKTQLLKNLALTAVLMFLATAVTSHVQATEA